MEFNHLPHLPNTGFTIIEIVLWWRTVESENMQIPYFSVWHEMAIFGLYLIDDNDFWKHFNYCYGQICDFMGPGPDVIDLFLFLSILGYLW